MNIYSDYNVIAKNLNIYFIIRFHEKALERVQDFSSSEPVYLLEKQSNPKHLKIDARRRIIKFNSLDRNSHK